ncbi:protein 5NUC-like [Chelonus insularis]|uniref:protein 5NUC-like n=1 Tax=Chelonus insularis TaxID=460826 RepID=UPI00158E3E95|nr:protein 5NUC-like [Chelonus insularis]XP_034952447.1 protein 5NUC-like [Chelonus insularis]XP_034952448.1 protein 5NUC-like [Chelonus insularis]
MVFKGIFKLLIILISITNIFAQPTTNDDRWTLRVLHTNDMHARFEQTSALSTKCVPKDAKAGKCYGGFARIATLVRQAKNSSVPTLFLNAGDTYQGTAWFTVYKWEIVSKFLNLLKPDAISLGNHEFDDGPKGLIPFIKNAMFPIVTCNLNLTGEPQLAATKIKNSIILDVKGKKVGIIGYLTPETKSISNAGNVIFLDEIEPIRQEVKKLQAQGVDILIALGHSGFSTDKRIAAEVDGLDLVIGGHTNTFLYTGKQSDIEVPEGLYPTVVTQKSGRKVYVVQAYAYTKYLGDLTIDFDSKGEIQKIMGNPILVNSSIAQAQDILDELDKWRPAIDNLTHTEVGYTKVLLQGNSKECRRQECNLGNLIADTMVEYVAKEYGGSDGWTDAAVAIFNSGSIRTSIDKTSNVSVLMSDILAVLPFNNVIGKVNLTGKQLLEILEFNVDSLEDSPAVDLKGKFLQVSGIQVVYNLLKPVGSRVASVLIRCAKCRVPEYEKLEVNNTYTIIISDFLHGGGDGFDMLRNHPWTITGITTDQTLVEYFKQKSPVYPGVEWRIRFDNKQDNSTTGSASGLYLSKAVIVLIAFFFISI